MVPKDNHLTFKGKPWWVHNLSQSETGGTDVYLQLLEGKEVAWWSWDLQSNDLLSERDNIVEI